jgi:hypothetical protein
LLTQSSLWSKNDAIKFAQLIIRLKIEAFRMHQINLSIVTRRAGPVGYEETLIQRGQPNEVHFEMDVKMVVTN